MRPAHIVLAICLILFLSACGTVPQALATPTVPLATATATSTPFPTSTPVPSPIPARLISAETCQDLQQVREIGDGAINVLVYSPDGRWLAAASTGGVTLYDASALKAVWSAQTRGNLTQIAFTKNGDALSGVDTSFNLYQWQTSDGIQLLAKQPADINELPMAFALSPDGAFVVAPYYDDTLHIYGMGDASLSGKLEQFLSLGEMIQVMAISPDTKHMASISVNGDLRLWNLTDLVMLGVLEFRNNQHPTGLFFAPNGELLVNFVSSDGDKSTRVMDVPSQTWGQLVKDELIAVAADNAMFSLSVDGIALRSLGSNEISQTLPEQAGVQGRIASSPNGAFLAVGTTDGIHIWQREGATPAGKFSGRYTDYSSMAVSPDGRLIAASTPLGVEIINSASGVVQSTLLPGEKRGIISGLVYAPSGGLLAGMLDKTVFVWHVASASLLWSAEADDSFNALAFSADGGLLAGAYNQPVDLSAALPQPITGLITIWDAAGGQILTVLEGKEQIVMPGYSSLVFSADGRTMLAGANAGDVEIWQVADWSLVKSLSSEALLGWYPHLAIAPDGRSFIIGGQDRQVIIRKLPEGVVLRSSKPAKGSLNALAYSVDGSIIATGVQQDIDLWESASLRPVCKLSGSHDTPIALFFTPDQHSLISLAKDGIIRVWGLP